MRTLLSATALVALVGWYVPAQAQGPYSTPAPFGPAVYQPSPHYNELQSGPQPVHYQPSQAPGGYAAYGRTPQDEQPLEVPSEEAPQTHAHVEADPYQSACGSSWGDDCSAACGMTKGCGCGGTGCGACGAKPCSWFGGVSALFMNRDRGNHYFWSFDDNNEIDQLLDTRRASMDVGYGVEARLGRCFGCGRFGIEGVYWGIYPETQTAQVFGSDVVGNLNAILDFDQLDYDGALAGDFVDNAMVHQVRRKYEFHNFEANLLAFSQASRSGRLNLALFSGFRFFRFEEDLQFGANTVATTFTGAADELFYTVDTENNLFGWQIGGRGRLNVTDRFFLTGGTSVGIYANYIEHLSRISGAAGVATINNGPNMGREFLVDNNKTDVAFLGQLDIGFGVRILERLSATAGYRVVGVSGVALPTEQIYPDLRGIQDVELVQSNGNLILHGGYVGLEFGF